MKDINHTQLAVKIKMELYSQPQQKSKQGGQNISKNRWVKWRRVIMKTRSLKPMKEHKMSKAEHTAIRVNLWRHQHQKK
jgi:hypothetical protein